MKKTSLFAIILVVTSLGCNKSKDSEYIFLNAEQLKPLGIELTENGVFYKNFNTTWVEDNERYPVLGFYSTNDTYLQTMHHEQADTIMAKDRDDSLFLRMAISSNNFYPVLIGNVRGQYSLDRKERDMELVPIAICMAETKLSKRTDTLVIWFKPTKSLEEVLPNNIKLKDYLRLPDLMQ